MESSTERWLMYANCGKTHGQGLNSRAQELCSEFGQAFGYRMEESNGPEVFRALWGLAGLTQHAGRERT